MAAAPVSASEFLDLVRKSGVLPAGTLDQLTDIPSEPTACAAALIAKGLITKFQARLLLAGRYKGFRLGPYIVRDQIGQGGMGAVYLAEHETLRRKVALKILTPPKDTKDSQLALERFLREARASAALDHPNIVRLHDVGNSGSTHFLVLEYVEGQSLEELLQKAGPISPSRAVGYIAQAAAGLQQAYEKGFVHRDIKPGNLMLTKDGTVKILDMGLARPTDDNDKLTEILDKGAIVGTADFISPEQAMNAPLDIRSDIYSLGATFFALVTGQPPFAGSTTQKLIQHQLKEAPSLTRLDKTFPHGLARVVQKMLEKRAENRYQTPAELIAALAEWLPQGGGHKVVAGLSGAKSAELENTISEVVSATQRFDSKTRLAVQRKARQRQMLMYAGGAAAVLIFGGLIGWALSGSGTKDEPVIVKNDPPPQLRTGDPKPGTKPATKTTTPPKSTGPISTPPPIELPSNVLVSLPLSNMRPFAQTISTYMDGTVRRLKVINEDGPGLPKPWYRWIELPGTVADVFVEDTDEGKILGIRGDSGPPGIIMVTSPTFNSPREGRVKIRVSYRTEANSSGGAIRYRQMKPEERMTSSFALAPTDGEWKTVETIIELKGAENGLFELTTSSIGPNTAIRFKVFEVLLVDD